MRHSPIRNQSDIEDYPSSGRIMVPPERKVVSKTSQHGFVRSGLAGAKYSSGSWSAADNLYSPGNNAYYWSRSSSSSADNARNLNFNDTNVNPSNNNNRYNGRSLRCL